MKLTLRHLGPLALLFLVPRLVAVEPGYVDFGKIAAAKSGEYVEVNIGAGLLKCASVIAKCSDKEAANLISGLTHVRVNVIGLDDTNRAAAMERVMKIRADLVSQGWDQIVTARGKKAEDVAIFVKQHGDDAIAGVVVTVMDENKKEAVLINVVGNIKPEQLAVVGEHLHIDQLRLGKKAEKS